MSNYEEKKKVGFSLAEVLITLGIIGVVAALTIPQLRSAYRKHIVETRLEKFYSTINQAIMLAEDDYGEREGWEPVRPGHSEQDDEGNFIESSASDWVKKYLLPYMKGDKKFSEKDGYVYIYMLDGSVFTADNNKFVYYPEGIKFNSAGEAVNITPAVNEFVFFYKPDENTGLDRFTGRNIEPYKHYWDGDVQTLKSGHDLYSCYDGSHPQHIFCAALIQQNGWKIPADYPYKF